MCLLYDHYSSKHTNALWTSHQEKRSRPRPRHYTTGSEGGGIKSHTTKQERRHCRILESYSDHGVQILPCYRHCRHDIALVSSFSSEHFQSLACCFSSGLWSIQRCFVLLWPWIVQVDGCPYTHPTNDSKQLRFGGLWTTICGVRTHFVHNF